MTEGFHHWTLSVDLRFKQFGEMFWLRFLWSYTVRMSQGIPIYEFPWQRSTWVCVLAGARLIMAELFHVLMKASGSPQREFQGDKGVKKVLTRLDISLSAGFLSPLCPVCIGLMLHSLFLDFLSKYLHITTKSKSRRSYFKTQGYHTRISLRRLWLILNSFFQHPQI